MKYRNILGSVFVSVLVVGANPVKAADGPVAKRVEFKPTLSIGGTWKVAVEKMSEAPDIPKERLADWKPTKSTVVFQFTVEMLEDIDIESCYRIRIESKTLNGKPYTIPVPYFRIYLRQAGLTLKKVERLNAKTDLVQASRLFEAGPVDATDWVSDLPLAVPSFQEGQFDQEPPVRRRKDGSAMAKPSGHCLQKEEIVRFGLAGKETDALRITLDKKGDDVFPGHTTQTWVKGEPWWTEATYDRDGRQGRSARLLKE
ncbi:MAG: hypothetical protein WCK89_21160 [bacterium]